MSADIGIIRGNNYPPIQWLFLQSENPDVLLPLAGSIMKLTLIWPGGSIAKTSGTDPELVIDTVGSVLTWNYSAAQSRSLPLGRVAQYEIERWLSGSQQTQETGFVVVEAGNNPD